MSNYDKIAWLPICGGVTGLGLVLSYLAMRSRGLRTGLRGAAWSLLPIAAYLTGSIKMFWKMGTAIGEFAKGFAFSAEVWAGIAVAGVAFVLLVSTGGVRRGKKVKGDGGKATVPGGTAATAAIAPRAGAGAGAGMTGAGAGMAGAGAGMAGAGMASAPARASKPGKAAAKVASQADDDDFKDIEEILRRRGIS